MQKLALGVSAAAMLASSAVFAEKITVTGCPVQGVTSACLILIGKDGKVYDLTEIKASFDPAKNRGIVASGEVQPGISICNQGTLLREIDWTYSEEQCPGNTSQ